MFQDCVSRVVLVQELSSCARRSRVTFHVFLPAVAWVLLFSAPPSRHFTDQSEDSYAKIKEMPTTRGKLYF